MNNTSRVLIRTGIGAGLAIVGYLVFAATPWTWSDPAATGQPPLVGKASVSELQATYRRWSQTYAASAPAGPVVTLQWTRGLSRTHSDAKGIAQMNLRNRILNVRIKGLEDVDTTDVWLVENRPGDGRSVLPEPGDRMIKAGALTFANGNAWLDAQVDELADFQVDLVVVARRGGEPGKDAVLTGTTSLFQKVYHYPRSTLTSRVQDARPASSLMRSAMATGITPPGFFPGIDSQLVNRGRELFFNESFNGNGRTCGTCHREDDNMALGIRTIASLPDDDPLFIVEQRFRRDGSRNPLFNEYRMEKPELMRTLGLFVENLNGFMDPDTQDFTHRVSMRAPNHVLSVRTTLAPPPIQSDDGTLPVHPDDLVFAERTGWSGDGTPTGFRDDFFASNGRELTGSLRDFTIGAIVQHFPLTLERSASSTDAAGSTRQPDFRFATEAELDALEAFMLSIGRQEENQALEELRLNDAVAERGRLNYMGFNVFDADPEDGRPALNCNACHFNGGANTNPQFPFPPSVTPNHDLADIAAAGGAIPSHNRSFGPQVERLADQAGDIIVQSVDDPSTVGNCFNEALGETPLFAGGEPGTPSSGCDANPLDNGFAGGFGDDFANQRVASHRFNAPPVFEAMDNPPFFHGHQINTIEGSVAFYAANRHLRNGENLGPIVPLNAAQIVNVARFMRVMGADFNAESAKTLLRKALGLRDARDRETNIKLALAEIEDAIELLDPVDLHFDDAVPLLKEAQRLLIRGRRASSRVLSRATDTLIEAQQVMVNRQPAS